LHPHGSLEKVLEKMENNLWRYFVSLVRTASRIFVVLVIVVSFSRLYPLPRTNFPEMNCRVNFDYSPALVSVAKKRTRAVRNRASLIHLRS